MKSIVSELQTEALDREVQITDLLRKSLLVARKLKVTDIEEWIELELNGYGVADKIPKYRKVKGQVKAKNPMRGWIPVSFKTSEDAEVFSKQNVGQPISEIVSLSKSSEETGDGFLINFSPEMEQFIMRAGGRDMQPALHVSKASIDAILDAVKTIILKWTLKLEEDGIMGDGLSFSKIEKEKAAQTSYSINNFYGSVSHSQIQQSTTNSTQCVSMSSSQLQELTNWVTELKKDVDRIGLASDREQEFAAELKTIESQLSSSNPKKLILHEAIHSVRNILEGATGRRMSA
jgi:hypothetical protein